MEQATDGLVQREELTGREGAASATAQVWFTTKEVLVLTGLSRNTLKFWRKRKWVVPGCKGGMGREARYSAWQTIALLILASAVRSKHDQRTYVGSVGVRNAWEQLSCLPDALLLDDQQDMRLSEEVSAALGRMASAGPELPPDVLDGVARVVEAIDRKVRTDHVRNNRW